MTRNLANLFQCFQNFKPRLTPRFLLLIICPPTLALDVFSEPDGTQYKKSNGYGRPDK